MIEKQIKCLAEGLLDLLNEKLSGIYMIGSYALNDYRTHASDLDLMIIIERDLSVEEVSKIAELHKELNRVTFEVSYVTEDMLIKNTGYKVKRWYYNDVLKHEAYGPEWFIDRYVLIHHGIQLYNNNFDMSKVSQEFSEVLKGNRLFFEEHLTELVKCIETLSDEYLVFVLLSLCRVYYTFKFKCIVSKTSAASWMKETYDIKSLDQALRWSKGTRINRASMIQSIMFVDEMSRDLFKRSWI